MGPQALNLLNFIILLTSHWTLQAGTYGIYQLRLQPLGNRRVSSFYLAAKRVRALSRMVTTYWPAKSILARVLIKYMISHWLLTEHYGYSSLPKLNAS